MAFGWTDWRKPDGGRATIYVIGLDVGAASLSLPRSFDEKLRRALEPVGNVVIDASDVGKLGVRVGDEAEVNGHRVRVAGLTHGMRAIGGANVFLSRATAATVLGDLFSTDRSAYFLLQLRDPGRIETVRRELQPPGDPPTYHVLRPSELSALSQSYWARESGAGASFAFSTLLGLIVGIAITSQTLRSAILASVREYAALRALGVPLRALRAVVLEQSFWVGVTGIAVAGALTLVVRIVAALWQIPISLPFWSLLAAALLTLVVALISGLLALAPLRRTEPAELLR
jgi:putative ABC transport system permease protein